MKKFYLLKLGKFAKQVHTPYIHVQPKRQTQGRKETHKYCNAWMVPLLLENALVLETILHLCFTARNLVKDLWS